METPKGGAAPPRIGFVYPFVCPFSRAASSINRIIKNRIYTGVICNGDSQSEVLPDLQIISEETFLKAQEMMEKRVTHHSEVPLNTRGQSLLVGNVSFAEFQAIYLEPEDEDDKKPGANTLLALTEKVGQAV